MAAIRSFVRREPVLLVAAFAALLSCTAVPPDTAYLQYIDWRTLALLYCLMVVVAGLRQAGLFSNLAHTLCEKAGTVRRMGTLLVMLCFFSSMAITNDVALLTFVPFAVVVLGMAHRQRDLIRVVALQTVAANLGSALTPVGNPQNLYLYSYYDLTLTGFFRIVFPVWAASLALIAAACLLLPNERIEVFLGEAPGMERRRLWLYLALFAMCLLAVARVITWPVMLAAVAVVLLCFDRRALREADFMLLLTFLAFFIFAGNLARLDATNRLIRTMLDGRVFLSALGCSQVISNVPAALLLSGFTGNGDALVNIGGLGTPIASLASLISLKLYSHAEHAHTGRYLLEFTVWNAALLAVLSALQSVL